MVFSISCEKDNPVIPVNDANFAIYFLRDSTLKVKDMFYQSGDYLISKNIDSLELAESPWISDGDFVFYDYSSHCMYLKTDKSYFFPGYKPYYQMPYSWVDRPFVVVANNVKKYVGYFQSFIYTEKYWPFPNFADYEVSFYPKDIIHLNWDFIFSKDTRNNEYIKQSLKDLSLLHEGIAITIDSLWIDNLDTASIRYQINLTNNDRDNLYVLDFDKMGSGLFHYYNNGPAFVNKKNIKIVYEAIYRTTVRPNPISSYNLNWFTRVEAGKTLRRTIALSGYPHLPDGEYICQFIFNNPVTIEIGNRNLSDGRIWIGFKQSEIIGFNLGDTTNQQREKKIWPAHDIRLPVLIGRNKYRTQIMFDN
jgi:hypothetical protein